MGVGREIMSEKPKFTDMTRDPKLWEAEPGNSLLSSIGKGTYHSLQLGCKEHPCMHNANMICRDLPRRQRASWLHVRASCSSE